MIGAVANALGREVKVYVSPAAIRGSEPTGSSRHPEGRICTPLFMLLGVMRLVQSSFLLFYKRIASVLKNFEPHLDCLKLALHLGFH